MDKPFAILEEWVRQGRIHLSHQPAAPGVPLVDDEPRDFAVEQLPDGLTDKELFDLAMKNVKSLGWSSVPLHNRPPVEIQPQDEEQDALRALEEFVRNGNIDIERTAEYIEGSVHPHGRLYLDDLRSGRFSVQVHLDLHGLNLQDARFVLEEFLLGAVRAGFTCVRVIHGRGRHSHKHHPNLQENIQRSLCTQPMRLRDLAST